jgi:hypothetical protein
MVYIGQSRCSTIETSIKDHHWHIQLYHHEKSAVAEHGINLGYHIQFLDTSILPKKSICVVHLIKEVIEILLHPDNMVREEGFSLNGLWRLEPAKGYHQSYYPIGKDWPFCVAFPACSGLSSTPPHSYTHCHLSLFPIRED